MGRKFGIAFSIALALVIANAIISYRAINTLVKNNDLVLHTEAVIAELSDTLSMIREAETRQRGFLITEDQRYLQPYQEASTRVSESLKKLRGMAVDNSAQQQRLTVLEQQINTRLETLEKNRNLRQERGLNYIREMGMFEQGTNQMEAIRQTIAELLKEETNLLAIRSKEAKTSGRDAVLTFALANLLVAGLFIVVYQLVKRDIGERQRNEEALRRVNERLETRVQERTSELGKINTELERSNRELQDFAFVASHDLQEPLRKIQAFGDRLRIKFGDKIGEEGVDHLARMQNAAKRMQTLINDLLTFSRVTTKAQPFVPVDLEKTAKEVLEDLETRIQQTNGQVEIGELPTIDADALQMRQLLQNLIGNALKFHRPDVPPIVKVDGKILNGNDEQDSASKEVCQIEFTDNGIGFEIKYLDRIFTPFQRLHARHEYEGTGMGLAVCRKIVERHGGAITAESTPNEGTKFIITLPVKQFEGATE